MKKNALIVGGIVLVAGAAFAGGRVFAPAQQLYAKDPNTGTCVVIKNVSTTFSNLQTSVSGSQAKITSKNSGRQYLLFEDAGCSTNPIYFR